MGAHVAVFTLDYKKSLFFWQIRHASQKYHPKKKIILARRADASCNLLPELRVAS